MPLTRSHWFQVVLSHFVLCTFLGLIVLDLLRDPLDRLQTMDVIPLMDALAGSLTAGLVVAAATWLLHRLWLRRIRMKYYRGTDEEERRRVRRQGTLVGFVCGALGPAYVFIPSLVPLLALVFLALSVGYARNFLSRAAVMLRAGNNPRPADIVHLVFLYGALIACFTVLNSAVIGIHRIFDVRMDAFRGIGDGPVHIVDTLYFTIVTMTTLGFGDITPHSPDAKLLVIFEALIAYILFALLIGTITRGILPQEEPEESAQEDPPEER